MVTSYPPGPVLATPAAIGRTVEEVYAVLAALDRPCFVLEHAGGIGATNDETAARRSGGRVLAVAPAMPAHRLGAADFLRDHGVRYPYMAGAMANGIASERLVVAMAKAGFLASFGAAGVVPDKIDAALAAIRRAAPGLPFACNLIHSPNELELERAIVELSLRHGVTCVEASAFLELTPQIVRYRLAGLSRDAAGGVRIAHRVLAKLSRTEIAELFLAPAPDTLVRPLVSAGLVSAEQAELARFVPMADDITVEADSGGHTDRRPLAVLLPEIISLRDRVVRERGYRRPVRVGAAGGLGTPSSVFAAFAMGAAYVVTGSVNQPCVESGQSVGAKRLLGAAEGTDCAMAPSSDMFEMGVEVQVLRRGTMFASKAKRLFELYQAYGGIDDLPPGERAWVQDKVLRRPFADVWRDTVEYFEERDPEQIRRADGNPKRKMALIFRWYLGLSSFWCIGANPERVTDYQIWCGPAAGAFNTWVRGTHLEAVENRSVVDVAANLMTGAAFAGRVAQLRFAGVKLPAACSTYRPVPLATAGGRS